MQVHFLSGNIFMDTGAFILFLLFIFLLFITTVVLLSFFFKERRYNATSKEISIVIPAYNEERSIRECLSSIESSRYDMNKIEVIVVDDGSTDRTLEEIERYRSGSKLDIRVERTEHLGKVEAVNRGIGISRHDLVLCIDADVMLHKDTIIELSKPMQEKDVGAVNCAVFVKDERGVLGAFQYLEYCLNNLIRISFSRIFTNSIWFFGAAALYRKEAIEKVGNFRRCLTEDMDIALRLNQQGYRIITSRYARISTSACQNLKELSSQRMRWYSGALQSLFQNRILLKSKLSIPVAFLFINQLWWSIYSFISIPLIAYQVSYWFPDGALAGMYYLFRWFSMAGPFYVLYKLPEWGLNFLNIFGVLSGIMTLFLTSLSLIIFRRRITLRDAIGMFFYFPYTILINVILLAGLARYSFSKKRYFID